MRVLLDDDDTATVLRLLEMVDAHLVGTGELGLCVSDVLVRGDEGRDVAQRLAAAPRTLVSGIVATLRAAEVGIDDDERRRRDLAVQTIGDQLTAHGETS